MVNQRPPRILIFDGQGRSAVSRLLAHDRQQRAEIGCQLVGWPHDGSMGIWGDGAVVVPWRFDSAVSVGARPEQGRRPWQFAGLLGCCVRFFAMEPSPPNTGALEPFAIPLGNRHYVMGKRPQNCHAQHVISRSDDGRPRHRGAGSWAALLDLRTISLVDRQVQ